MVPGARKCQEISWNDMGWKEFFFQMLWIHLGWRAMLAGVDRIFIWMQLDDTVAPLEYFILPFALPKDLFSDTHPWSVFTSHHKFLCMQREDAFVLLNSSHQYLCVQVFRTGTWDEKGAGFHGSLKKRKEKIIMTEMACHSLWWKILCYNSKCSAEWIRISAGEIRD